MSESKRPPRFTMDEDLALLRETFKYNPFQDSHRWRNIHRCFSQCTKKPFTFRAIRERIDHLMKCSMSTGSQPKKKCETEEDYNERQKLLVDIKDLKRRFQTSKKQSSAKPPLGEESKLEDTLVSNEDTKMGFVESFNVSVKKEPETASPIDSKSTPSLSPPILELPSPPKRISQNKGVQNSALLYLEKRSLIEDQRQQQSLELEKQKIALEERRIVLEEKKMALEVDKFELEKLERQERLKIEIKEREIHLGSIDQQQKLVAFCMRQMDKK